MEGRAIVPAAASAKQSVERRVNLLVLKIFSLLLEVIVDISAQKLSKRAERTDFRKKMTNFPQH